MISAVSQSLVDGVGGSTAVRSSWPAGALWDPIKFCYHQCPQERNTGGHGRSGRSSTGKSVTVPAGMLSQSADAAGRKRQANDVSHELLECEAGWLRPRRLGACCGRRRVRCGLGTRGCLGQPADRRCCGQAHPRKPMRTKRRKAPRRQSRHHMSAAIPRRDADCRSRCILRLPARHTALGTIRACIGGA